MDYKPNTPLNSVFYIDLKSHLNFFLFLCQRAKPKINYYEMSIALNSVANTNEDMRPELKRTGEAIPYSFKKHILSKYEN
jgi:hypothetical protein